MEHYNPILGSEPNGQKFITCGEIMLRLTPPNYEKIRMASSFEASYGGSEANIALALANLGVDSTFFSVVPNNSLGKSAVRWLRSNDVHCTPMILTEPNETPSNRLGTYYLETGYGIRASKVIYDRKHSAITEYDFSQVDLDALLDGYDWLHLSGITPALGPNCRGLIIDMLKVARYADVAHERFPEAITYFQQDYMFSPYGGSYVGRGGCGITTMAMLATYMTDTVLTPDMLAARYPEYHDASGTRGELFRYTPAEMGFYLEKTSNSINEVIAALQNGQRVISLQHLGVFTSGGHYLLLQQYYDGNHCCYVF